MKVKTPTYLLQKEPWREKPFDPSSKPTKDPLYLKVESLVTKWLYNANWSISVSSPAKQLLIKEIIRLIKEEK